MIPLYSAAGALLGHYPAEHLESMPGVELRYNRRGYLKRARVKDVSSIVRLTPDGFAFRQQLDNGLECWALSGTTGT